MTNSASSQRAYFGPFLVFLGLFGLGDLVKKPFEGMLVAWPLSTPMYWVFPLQTLVCGWLVWRWWSHYELRMPTRPIFTILIGLLVLGIWVAPQEFFHAERRLDGFEPGYFGGGAAYWVNLIFRFLRLVIVVPLVEEIFWRGFLLRYFVDQDSFRSVPFGKFTWISFIAVTLGFTFEHSQPDWPAAALCGALYNVVAYYSRSLSACVLAHAVTNFALGIYVLRTGQWGFW